MHHLKRLFRRGQPQQAQAMPATTAAPVATNAPMTTHAAPAATTSADPKQIVQEAISSHKVAVFSKSYCPFCKKAKQTLGSMLRPTDMFVMELDQRADGDAIQQVLSGMTGSSSVPKVFIGGQFIGGGDDTVAKAANGELAQLLQAQGLGAVAA